MKKSVIAALIAVSLSFSATACSQQSSNNSANNTPINTTYGVYSAYFNDYNDLSNNLIKNLKTINESVEQSDKDISASILHYLEAVESSNSVMIPKISGENLKLRQKEDYYSISLETKELYSRPWLFFSFDDNSNSYVKITNVSSEIEQFGTENILEFMNVMDPVQNDDLFYPPYVEMHEETVDINGRATNVLFAKMKNDTRIYTNFLYDGFIVIICCSQEKIDSGFLNEFGLGTLDLR